VDERSDIELVMLEARPTLMSMLRRMLPFAQAEEVVQEAYLRLHVSSKALQGEELRRYLCKTTRNIAISRLRHEKVVRESNGKLQVHYQLGEESQNAEQKLINEHEKKLLLEAINAMPPVCRQVFIQRKIYEKPQSEIAELMGISINTVQNHLTNGMKFCRAYMLDSLRHSKRKSVVAKKVG